MGRQLQPRTREQYAYHLKRAFGDLSEDCSKWSLPDDLGGWGDGSRKILRAAMQSALKASGASVEAVRSAISGVPVTYGKRRLPRPPTEAGTARYEQAATTLGPGQAAIALLPFKLGLRASELCGLERSDVARAMETGVLVVTRKGGHEHALPAKHVKGLFGQLLATKAKLPRKKGQTPKLKDWKRVGEIICAGGKRSSMYQALYKLITGTAKLAGLKIRPHLLRHAFATGMNRRGASIFTIKEALGHSDVKTTSRYISPSLDDIARYIDG